MSILYASVYQMTTVLYWYCTGTLNFILGFVQHTTFYIYFNTTNHITVALINSVLSSTTGTCRGVMSAATD